MRENIIHYLKEHGKSDINTIAAALDMAGAKKFPSLIKEISQMESKRLLRFSDDGAIALRKPKEEKKRLLYKAFSEQTRQALVFYMSMMMKTTCL